MPDSKKKCPDNISARVKDPYSIYIVPDAAFPKCASIRILRLRIQRFSEGKNCKSSLIVSFSEHRPRFNN
jgi:hypothetical protein